MIVVQSTYGTGSNGANLLLFTLGCSDLLLPLAEIPVGIICGFFRASSPFRAGLCVFVLGLLSQYNSLLHENS